MHYGWGWGLPVAWQGWTFFIAWIIVLPLGHRLLPPGDKLLRWGFTGAIVILTGRVIRSDGDGIATAATDDLFLPPVTYSLRAR
jgi:hypothetical protein